MRGAKPTYKDFSFEILQCKAGKEAQPLSSKHTKAQWNPRSSAGSWHSIQSVRAPGLHRSQPHCQSNSKATAVQGRRTAASERESKGDGNSDRRATYLHQVCKRGGLLMSPKAAHLEATASAVSVKMTTAAIHATRTMRTDWHIPEMGAAMEETTDTNGIFFSNYKMQFIKKLRLIWKYFFPNTCLKIILNFRGKHYAKFLTFYFVLE